MRHPVPARIARILGIALLALLSVASNAKASQPTAQDWTRIREVIAAQREALVNGEGARAAAMATEAVRRRFRSGQGFLEMVRESYAPLLDARYTEFLPGAVIEGVVVQPLRLVLPDDTVLVALYSLERQRDGRWRISGCLLAPSSITST